MFSPRGAVRVDAAEIERVWKPKLSSERIGSLDLGEAAEVLLRFTASRMKPAWLDLLGKYESYPHLRSGLDEDEKDALRELRNLGVGRHDGRWLFTPTPSSKFEPTDAGTFLLRLYHGDPPDSELLRSYFKQIMAVARERANREVLEKISREGKFPPQRRDKVRELRRMGLWNMNPTTWLTRPGYLDGSWPARVASVVKASA